MPAAVLRLHLANHHLITTGTKATMARRLFDAIHGTSSAITTTTTSSVTASSVIATSASATTLTSVPPLSLSTQQTATPGGFTPAQTPRINSFSSWLDAWNIYIAIVVAHNPSRALELLGYQRLIHSASKHFNTSAWLNYDVQFRTLAAANPQLQWNLRHSELWLDNMASHTGSSLPNTRWPCTYCGSMYHFPDRCPRCPFRTVQFNDGDTFQRDNGPRLSTCRDFNNSTCHRNPCRYQHHCQYCGSSSHPAYRCGRPPTSR